MAVTTIISTKGVRYIRCDVCGAIVLEGTEMCSQCGSPRTPARTEPRRPEPQPPHPVETRPPRHSFTPPPRQYPVQPYPAPLYRPVPKASRWEGVKWIVLAIVILMICSIILQLLLWVFTDSLLEGLEGGSFGALLDRAMTSLPSVDTSLYR